MVGVVNNFAPLLTVLLAGIMLGERMPTFKFVQLFVAFGGCLLMILASPVPQSQSEEGDANPDEKMSLSLVFNYICLALNPIAIAYGNVMMRKMRSLDENVVTCYMNSTAIPVFMGLCYATGGDLSAWREFEALEWIYIVALSFTVILS